MSSKTGLQNGLKRIRIQISDLRTQSGTSNCPIKKTLQQDSDTDDKHEILYSMCFRKLYDAVTKKRASRGKFGLDRATDEESDYSSQVGGTQMTTETVDLTKPEMEIPETDNGSNYCCHNNFGRVRMTTNPEQSSKHEAILLNNDERSMEIILEEGREAARKHHAQYLY